MMVREKGMKRGVVKGNLFGQVLEEVEGLSPLQLGWRTEDRRFTALGELIASDDIERHHWSGAGLAVVFDRHKPFVRAMVKQGTAPQLQPTVLSLVAIPAGRSAAYFGHNRRSTVLARRHHFGIYDGRIRLTAVSNQSNAEIHNPYDEPYWDLSKPPTSVPRNAVMVKERAAFVSAPFGGNFSAVFREDLGKYFVLVKDRFTGVQCVVAEIPAELIDQGLMAPEIHNDGAPVAVGDKLVAFIGVQTFMRLRDPTARIPLHTFLSRRSVLPRDVLNPDKYGSDLKIYTAMMNQLTNGVIERLRLVDQLPRKSDNLSDHRFRLWREDYSPSPNAHPEDWLPEAYVFHERGADQSDAAYFGALRLKMNLSFKEELERQVHGWFGIPAPVDGEIVSVTALPPDQFGKQGYELVFLGDDGHQRNYTLPWTASFPPYVRPYVEAPANGRVVAIEQLPPDQDGKQGYVLKFESESGVESSYVLPWSATFPATIDAYLNPANALVALAGMDQMTISLSAGEPMAFSRAGELNHPIAAKEVMAFACECGGPRISMRKAVDLLLLCDQNLEMATQLFNSFSYLLVQCRCEPVPSPAISGGKPGMMMSARYLEKHELPSPYYIWWDLRALLPFYRDDLGCALLPRLQWDTIGHTWKSMVIHCNTCRLDFQPHIESRVDKDFNGFPYTLIDAGQMRPKTNTAYTGVGKATARAS